MEKAALQLILERHEEFLDGKSSGQRADLTGADLTGANLAWEDLTGANLAGAKLAWADLTGAKVVGQILISEPPPGAENKKEEVGDGESSPAANPRAA